MPELKITGLSQFIDIFPQCSGNRLGRLPGHNFFGRYRPGDGAYIFEQALFIIAKIKVHDLISLGAIGFRRLHETRYDHLLHF